MSERHTEEQPAFTLYGDWLSTATQRVVFTALELKLTYEFRALDCIKAVDTRTPDYLAVNPFGRVPAAVVDGVTMYESRAIARMLAEKFQSRASQLLPTDFRGRALFEQWASLEVTTYGSKTDAINTQRVWNPMCGLPADEQKAKDAYRDWQAHLAILDQHLQANDYLAGQLTLVDLFLAPEWGNLVTTVEGKDMLQRYTNIAAWWSRMSARPSWQTIQSNIEQAKRRLDK